MKRTISLFFILLMCIASATALVKYTGQPQLPYLIYGQVELKNELVGGVKLTITNTGTGFSKEILTNEQGYWQEDATNWNTVSSRRAPLQYGDNIHILVQGECGAKDVCEKEFEVFSEGYEDYAEVNFGLDETKFPYLKQTIAGIISGLIVLALLILGSKFKWGKRFIGLVKYWSIKDPERAIKMINTALKREKSGYYNKKK